MDNNGFERDLESRKSVSSEQDVTSKLTVEQVKTEKRQIYKNLFLISVLTPDLNLAGTAAQVTMRMMRAMLACWL